MYLIGIIPCSGCNLNDDASVYEVGKEILIMNKLIYIITAASIGFNSWGAPLNKSYVAGDAQWMAHLDMQVLTKSTIGTFLLNLVREEISKNNDSPISIDVDLVAQELHSLTAYGSSITKDPDKNSVLIFRTGNRARTIIDGYIASAEMETDGKTGIKRLDHKKHDTYLIGNELYASFLHDDLWIASKSYEQIERAQDVIEGKLKSLENSDSKLKYTEESGFFFLATIEGLGAIADMPPQARILQKAQGGQIAFGEEGDMFKTQIGLSTPGPEVSSQLSRIIEGMIALASFAEVGDERLNTLMNNLVVEEGERHVTVGLQYPVVGLINIVKTLVAESKKPSKDKGADTEEI